MGKIYNSKISKEDFKKALTECFKYSWIMHSKENFLKALEWKENKDFEYNLDETIEAEEDYNSSSSAINLLETFSEILKKSDLDDDKILLKKWEEAWSDPNGFDCSEFAGEQIEDGNAVGEIAREYYYHLNAKENLAFNKNKQIADFSDLYFDDSLLETKKAVNDKNISYIFEATFEYDENNFKVKCDVLKIKENKHVEIIEVKATSEVKLEHIFDLMYQKWVLEKLGFIVDNTFICHLSDSYLHDLICGENVKEVVNEFQDSFGKISFEEIKEELRNLKPVPQTNFLDEIEYEKYLIVDDKYKEYKNGNIIFIFDVIKDFEKKNNLDELMMKLSSMFSRDEKWIKNYMQNDFCTTQMKYDKKRGWINVNDNEPDGLYCYHVIPWYDKTKENIFNFTNLFKKYKAQIYRKTGQIYLDNIDNLDSEQFRLKKNEETFWSEYHYRIFDVYKKYQNNNYKIDWNDTVDQASWRQLEKELDQYKNYPIYMYDFETVKWAVPRFEKTKGYQQIPFQYSVDIIYDENYNYNNISTMEHYDFIGEQRIDPRPKFIDKFLKDMFAKGPGIYVAYNKSFEQSVLKYLAFCFPEYAKPLLYIMQNTIDLMNFFKGQKANSKTGTENRDWFLIYHPNFHGSYSIKKTQPALDSTFSYDDLIINKGNKASQVFRQYIDGEGSEQWDEIVKPNMLKYCNRDTLAMVVILQRINEIFSNWKKDKKEKGEI